MALDLPGSREGRFFLLTPKGRDGPAGFDPGVGWNRAEDEHGAGIFVCCVSLVTQKLPDPPFRLVTSVLEAPSLFICWKGLSFPL